MVHDLKGESEPAPGERPEGMFRRGGRRIDRAASPSAASFEERLVGERVKGLSQLGRRGYDDLLQGDHRRGAGFHRRPARDLEVAHHLDRPVRGLRDCGRLAGQYRPRGGLGIHGVGLPGDSTCAPVAPVHFDYLVPGSTYRARESRPVATGALDAERGDASVTLGPGDQLLVAASIGSTRSIVEADPPRVDRHRHVDVLVGVHADDHLPRVGLDSPVVRHRWPPRALVPAGWADRTVMGRRRSRPLLGHCPSGQTGCRVNRRRTMTDKSIARTEGQSSCGSGHHPPAPTSVTARPRQAAE